MAPEIFSGLSHSFHSFKGIAAIVGLRAAEELAHATEDYLRELTRGKIAPTAGGLNALLQTAEQMERTILAFRAGNHTSQNESLLETLRSFAASCAQQYGPMLEVNPPPACEPPIADEPGAGSVEKNPFLAPSHVVRVDLTRLDDLMRIVGEMVIQRSRIDKEINSPGRRASVNVAALQEVNNSLSRSLRELREAVMRVRLVAISEIFSRMPFVLGDLARGTDKKVRLVAHGEEVQMDKYLIEQLKDPLLHLVRNAFAHGVEPASERKTLAKEEEATIRLEARTMGGTAAITVSDDGRGIDGREIARRAQELGLDYFDPADNASLLKVLCWPGFSTRTDADRAAGRGIGMAVVWDKVRELGGTLALQNEPGHGAAFTIRLPLTLAISQALIVSTANQTYAMPQNYVSEVMDIAEADVIAVSGGELLQYRGRALPVSRLGARFGLEAEPSPRKGLLVLMSERGRCGLLVDNIHGQKEIVVRGIRDSLIQIRGIAGATELGDGRPVLILDGEAFLSGALCPLENANPQANS